MRSWQFGSRNSSQTIRLSKDKHQVCCSSLEPWRKRHEQQTNYGGAGIRSWNQNFRRCEKSMQWVPVQHDGERNQRINSQLVFLQLYKRWSIYSIATKLSMQVHEMRRVLKEYKRKLKTIRRANANETTQNRRKLKTYHLQTLESSLDGRKGTRITISKLKRDPTQNHPELDGISDFCIRDALKNYWAFSFKKLERASKLSIESGRVRMFHESAKVLLNLLQGRSRQFSLMNFKIKAGFNSYYGWTERGPRGYINPFDSSFSINAINRFYQYRFYGVICSKKSIDSFLVIRFIDQLFKIRMPKFQVSKGDVFLFCDHVSYHKSSNVSNFLNS